MYNSSLALLAENLAKTYHEGQVYGSADVSYFEHHIKGVVDALKLRDLPEDYIIVGYLHDIVEDTSVTIETIENLFGTVIAEAVRSITKEDGEDRVTYLNRCKKNKIATIVKMYDAMFNATSCHINKNKSKFNYYLDTICSLK